MDKEQKKWIFILIILILGLLNLAILINEIKLIKGEDKSAEVSNAVVTNATNELDETTQYIQNHIKDQEENVRVQYYVADFLGLIESQKYDDAYKLLNEDFKKTNFDTVEKFIDFCKIYPTTDGVCKYSDFDRIGSSVYVITATVGKLNTTNEKMLKQTFVVRENDYNDYRISLQMDYSYVDSEGNVIK